MKVTIKNQNKDSVFTVGMIKAGKGEPFHWRPVVVPHLNNLLTMQYRDNGYDCKSYYVPMFCQIFWLGLIFYIKIHKTELGQMRMIDYNESHFAEIDRILSQVK